MVLRRSFTSIAIFIAVILFATALYALEEPLGEGPIVITAETLMADKKANSALFEGDVVARSADMTLMADRMAVTYAEGGGIERIEAEGNVKLLRGKQVVTSERAEYIAEERKIIFTGSPRAVEDANIVTGTKMIYLVEEDRFIVEGSRVLLEQTGEGGADNGERQSP